jgi:nucleoside-diphosphate-sugar epimerase
MQTILGANGQIAVELARELKRVYTSDIRLVSRNPKKVNATDLLVSADLLDAGKTLEAVKGSEIVYFTAGLPPDTKVWATLFPVMLRNALDAAKAGGAKFVYFDNTYMYPQDNRLLTEDTSFSPVGEKGKVRAAMASMVLEEIARQQFPVVICRAPEFYGPGKTQSITNALIIERIKQAQQPRVPVKDDTLRTLIWTPDASRAMAVIGNTPDVYGQTWHLPCDDNRLTYKQFVALVCETFGRELSYSVLSKPFFNVVGVFIKQIRELKELLPRYEHDNLFDSTKFKWRFPEFDVTTYRQGIELIRKEHETPRD